MQLQAIFTGKAREVEFHGKTVMTGIFKEQVEGPVVVHALNLEGDQQADLKVHGGIDKAVYAYPAEHYAFWKTRRPDLEYRPGKFGENLSVTGMDEKTCRIGDRFRIGSARFEITSPRMPCFKLGIKMGDPTFVKDFLDAQRNGFYFKVLEEGTIEAGDVIEQEKQDPHGLTVEEVIQLYTTQKNNVNLLKKAITAPALPGDWVEFFEKRLAKLS